MNLPALGIDIAKDFFDVALLLEGKSKHKIFSNTSVGMEQLNEWLAKRAIICAAMHKLLCLAYGVLKSGKPFDPNYGKKMLATP